MAGGATAYLGGVGASVTSGLSASAVGQVALGSVMVGLGSRTAVSGLTFGITEATGLGKLASGMDKLDRFQALAERALIQGSVTSLVTGQKLSKTLEAEGRSGLLAMGQSLVGDYAQSKGIADGSLAKIAMHATVGGVYTGVTTGNALSGAIGGGVSEALAPHMSSKSGSMLPGIAAIAAFASGGSVKDIKLASEVSGSAFEHNSLLHLVQDGTFLHDEENREGPSPYDKVKKTSEITADGVGKAGTWVKENPADAMSVAVDLTMLAINGPAAVSNFMASKAAKQSVKVGAKVAASGVSKVKPNSGIGKDVAELAQSKGRQKNYVSRPDPQAEGMPHTTMNITEDGKIRNYATFKANPKNRNPNSPGLELEKRVDLGGKPHTNKITKEPVPTPHVNDKNTSGGVRAAEPHEIPRRAYVDKK